MSEPRRKTWLAAAVALVSAAITGVVFLAAHLLLGPTRGESMNPYEYNLDAFLAVPDELILYAEGDSIDVPLREARGIASDPGGRIYVTGDSALIVFDKGGNTLRRIELSEAANCVAVGSDGTLFVGMKEHVEAYDESGSQAAVWTSLGENALITGMAAGGEAVFIADFGNRLIWHFDPSGRLRGQISGTEGGGGTVGFVLPSPHFDLAIGPEGSLWAANPGRQRVENYAYDGRFKGSWGRPSMAIEGFCGCCNPTNIAIAPDGSFVTSEKGLPRVKVYDAGGEFRGVVAAPRQFAEGTVGLDLAVDPAGRVLVLDPKAGAVRVFTRKAAAAGGEDK